MKRIASSGYTFSPAAVPPTVDLAGVPGASPGTVLAVIDVTSGALLYAIGTPGLGGTWVAAKLAFQTVPIGALATDQILVFLDDGAEGALDATAQAILAKLGTTLSVKIDGDSVVVQLPPGLAQDATVQAAATDIVAAGNANHADLSALMTGQHADLTAIHADVGTTLHADLGALLTRIEQTLAVGGTVAVSNQIAGFALDVTMQAIKTALGNPAQAGGAVSVSNLPATQAISGTVTSNAGTNASTAALALESGGHLASLDTKLPALVNGRSPVDGSGVTQPVSATALPLPVGAAKDTSLASILSVLQAVLTVQGTVTANLGTVAGLGLDTSLQSIMTKLGTTLAVSAASLPLPSGASTAANQATEIASLQAIATAMASVLAVRTAPTNGTGGYSGATIGTASSVALAARTGQQRDLTLRNESTSAMIAVAFGSTPALNTAGSFTLGPGDSLTWSGNYVPLDTVNAIASAAGASLTIGSH